MHTALVSQLLKDNSLWQTTTMDELASPAAGDLASEIIANP
jgi:hypothetical protein